MGKKTQSEVLIKIRNSFFDPPVVRVKKGTRVDWINEDLIEHEIDSNQLALFQSGLLHNKEIFSFIFYSKGKYFYHCGIHSLAEQGKVIVR
ncbi:hypothetical protein C4559_02490 [Candidatus Microgenomates bacterium]|nr:MAG: hypothetical protein C4559_02490 [Candidatus Microgenomates bacterium]